MILYRSSVRVVGRHGRGVHYISKMFIPSGTVTIKSTDKGGGGQGHERLLRAGYIRQSSAGIFSLLPLAQRVLSRLESRIDATMASLDASKMTLPTLSSKSLWEKTGRWTNAELYKLQDRKSADFCLAPTHEEQVTKLVAAEINGYRQLPVRLYQISKKFRDEMRPRGGMLRGKEFVMKDLYTFDDGRERAYETYAQVRLAYDAFFKTLQVPFLVAEADSGNIGGDLSHEYHLPSPVGEDTLMTCDACSYVANQELAKTTALRAAPPEDSSTTQLLRFTHDVYRDSRFFDINVPLDRSLNQIKLLRAAQKLDPSTTKLIPIQAGTHTSTTTDTTRHEIQAIDVIQVIEGDACPSCSHGTLHPVQAIEIGHTFYLGTKYSAALDFKYTDAKNTPLNPEMGCHGIGVTRLLAALAELGHDSTGLTWPPGLEPFHTVLVTDPDLHHHIPTTIARQLKLRIHQLAQCGIAIDDRKGKSLGYKVAEMHQLGAPNVLVLGSKFFANNPSLSPSSDTQNLESDLDNLVVEQVVARGDRQKAWKLVKLKDWIAQIESKEDKHMY